MALVQAILRALASEFHDFDGSPDVETVYGQLRVPFFFFSFVLLSFWKKKREK